MTSVEKHRVPLYLQEGEFFKSLTEGDDNCITVPDNVLKPDAAVETNTDLVHLLSSLRFWVVLEVPNEVYYYFLKDQSVNIGLLAICQEFEIQFPILKSLHVVMSVPPPQRINSATHLQSLLILKFLHIAMHYELDADLCTTAVISGACDCLRYAHENGCEINEYCCEMAATSGHLDCLAYLHSVNASWDIRVCRAAVTNGHLLCLKFAVEHGCAPPTNSAPYAAFGGHLDCLKYVLEQGDSANRFVAIAAAGQGHLHILQFLHSIQAEWDVTVTARAAERGHLECLRFLHEHGCAWDFTTCHNAAYLGHLPCLQYAHQHDCRLNSSTTLCAVGHVACLEYLHEQGCPWHEGVCLNAVHKHHKESALFAVLHGAPHTFEFYAYVENSGWAAVLEALHARGYPEKYDEEDGDDICDDEHGVSNVFTF